MKRTLKIEVIKISRFLLYESICTLNLRIKETIVEMKNFAIAFILIGCMPIILAANHMFFCKLLFRPL